MPSDCPDDDAEAIVERYVRTISATLEAMDVKSVRRLVVEIEEAEAKA